jgi:PAS domain S-box-containing protein
MRSISIWLKDAVGKLRAPAKSPPGTPGEEDREAGQRRRAGQAPGSVASLDQIVNCIADPIFVKDHRHRLVLVNDAECALAGRSREELLGRTDHDILPRQQREAFWQQDDRVIETGLESVSEDEIPDAQGIVRTVITRKTRFTDSGGNRFVVGVIRDITERKQAERALESAKDYAESLIATANAMVIGLDVHGSVRVFNQAAERITGYARAELEGRNWFEVIAPRERYPRVWEEFERLTAGGLPGEYENQILTRAGQERHVAWRNTVLRERGELVGTISFGIDITERKQAEEQLRRAEENYRSIYDNAVEGIYRSSREGGFIAANPAMARMLGYDSVQELIESVTDVTRQLYVRPETRAEFQRLIEQQGFVRGFELQCYRKDGSIAWHAISTRAVRDQAGAVICYEGIAEDITERKQAEAELRENQERLRLAQKMEAVGRLAAGVAHDFNNMLAVIMGSAELMRMRLQPDHPAQANAEDILKAATRAASLTRQLLAYSRKQVLQPKVLDLNAVVTEIEGMLRQVLGAHIEITAVLGPALGRVRADPGQLQQVVLNLVVNARDAMPEGGKLTIETANAELDSSCTGGRDWAVQPGPYVLLAVSDTGCGMDADTRARALEPFFTTKEPGKGTGLGLSTVYGIVKQSGGHIDICSEPGRGTTVRIHLPRADGALAPADRATCAPRPGWETVLLVEDEELVRQVIQEALTWGGYTVLEATSAGEAVALSASHEGPIDLLVTDLVMPGRNGQELAARMTELRPGIAVLCISGYADQAVVHRGQLDPGTAFLQKPFTPDTLLRTVREVLDEQSRRAA